jgi:zinc/manganese transport system substrate-binding protein
LVPVTASFTILADLVREVSGGRAAASAVVGPDQDSHHVDLAPSQALAIAQASAVVRLGLRFDSWIDRALEASSFAGPVVTASTGLPLIEARPGRPDPHVWQSAAHAGAMARTLATALAPVLEAVLGPGSAAGMPQLASAYADSIQADQMAAKARIAAIGHPAAAAARVAVVPHGSFAYLGEALGIRFVSLAELAPGGQLSARSLLRLADAARDFGAQVAFTENVADGRLMTQVAEAAGLRLAGQLVSDALTGPQGPAPTLRQLLAHNARVLEEAYRG